VITEWIAKVFEDAELLKKGHCQRKQDTNLGMGWLYYALTRMLRPREVVVIGSYRGFTPLVFAKGLADNLEGGRVTFVDPSFVDDFWKDTSRVSAHFALYGIDNIRHFLMTTQEFVETQEYRDLSDIGLVFVDGYHARDQACFDFEAFEDKLAEGGIVLFHDSVEVATTPIYGKDRVYERRVRFFIDELKTRHDLQIFDIPLAKGLTLVSRKVKTE